MMDSERELLQTLPLQWQADVLTAEVARTERRLEVWQARMSQQVARQEEVIASHPRDLGLIDDLQEMLQRINLQLQA